jgi:hypothetical protein
VEIDVIFFRSNPSRVGILEGSKSICAINQYGKPREEIEANAKLLYKEDPSRSIK